VTAAGCAAAGMAERPVPMSAMCEAAAADLLRIRNGNLDFADFRCIFALAIAGDNLRKVVSRFFCGFRRISGRRDTDFSR
jgi:hypothetical protein